MCVKRTSICSMRRRSGPSHSTPTTPSYSPTWVSGWSIRVDLNAARLSSRNPMVLNPLHADWIHFALFLDHYRKGEYREALGVQLKMNVPNNQGIQAGLAAVYGQLGDTG